jgi:hypothetical protein
VAPPSEQASNDSDLSDVILEVTCFGPEIASSQPITTQPACHAPLSTAMTPASNDVNTLQLPAADTAEVSVPEVRHASPTSHVMTSRGMTRTGADLFPSRMRTSPVVFGSSGDIDVTSGRTGPDEVTCARQEQDGGETERRRKLNRLRARLISRWRHRQRVSSSSSDMSGSSASDYGSDYEDDGRADNR